MVSVGIKLVELVVLVEVVVTTVLVVLVIKVVMAAPVVEVAVLAAILVVLVAVLVELAELEFVQQMGRLVELEFQTLIVARLFTMEEEEAAENKPQVQEGMLVVLVVMEAVATVLEVKELHKTVEQI